MKMIWSDNNNRMIHKGFTYHNKHFTWNESDEMYYYDESEELRFYLDTAEYYADQDNGIIWD